MRLHLVILTAALTLAACGDANESGSEPGTHELTVQVTGYGTGTVASSPEGILGCAKGGGTCKAVFGTNSTVTLSARPDAGFLFNGWLGAPCGAAATCTITVADATTVSASFVPYLFTSNTPAASSPGDGAPARNVWSVRTDGTAATPLTTSSERDSGHGLWSPDGEWVFYVSDAPVAGETAEFFVNVWRMRGDGSEQTPLTNEVDSVAAELQFASDGSLVFCSTRPLTAGAAGGVLNIWSMRPDGSVPRALTSFDPASDAQMECNPRVSENAVYFTSNHFPDDTHGSAAADTLNIFRVALEGGLLTPVTKFASATVEWPRPSADGSKLVFFSNHGADPTVDSADGAFNIWTIAADGTGLQRVSNVTNGVSVSSPPKFFAGGTRILVTASATPPGDTTSSSASVNVFAVDSATGSFTALTSLTDADSYFPAPSRDESVIFFGSNRSLDGDDAGVDSTNLFIMNADGTAPRPLTSHTEPNQSSYPPDIIES